MALFLLSPKYIASHSSHDFLFSPARLLFFHISRHPQAFLSLLVASSDAGLRLAGPLHVAPIGFGALPASYPGLSPGVKRPGREPEDSPLSHTSSSHSGRDTSCPLLCACAGRCSGGVAPSLGQTGRQVHLSLNRFLPNPFHFIH